MRGGDLGSSSRQAALGFALSPHWRVARWTRVAMMTCHVDKTLSALLHGVFFVSETPCRTSVRRPCATRGARVLRSRLLLGACARLGGCSRVLDRVSACHAARASHVAAIVQRERHSGAQRSTTDASSMVSPSALPATPAELQAAVKTQGEAVKALKARTAAARSAEQAARCDGWIPEVFSASALRRVRRTRAPRKRTSMRRSRSSRG